MSPFMAHAVIFFRRYDRPSAFPRPMLSRKSYPPIPPSPPSPSPILSSHVSFSDSSRRIPLLHMWFLYNLPIVLLLVLSAVTNFLAYMANFLLARDLSIPSNPLFSSLRKLTSSWVLITASRNIEFFSITPLLFPTWLLVSFP